MTANDNKIIITIEIVWKKQLSLSHVTFLSPSEVTIAFNISSSHANTNLPIRRFAYNF